jgi:hypothetical protein
MLRVMLCHRTIMITRIIMIVSTKVITLIGDYYQVQTCTEIAFDYGGSQSKAVSLYRKCANSGPNTNVIVNAAFNAGLESVGAALDLSFSMALWFSILMHLVGMEIYLYLTGAEGEMLRNVSFEKQLEAGMEELGECGVDE